MTAPRFDRGAERPPRHPHLRALLLIGAVLVALVAVSVATLPR